MEGRPLTSDNIPSPNFLYNIARSGPCQGGSSIAENVQALRRGALSIKEYPATASCSLPGAALVGRASDFRVDGMARVDTRSIDDIKGQIANGNPVVAAFRIDAAFQEHRGSRVYRSSGNPGASQDDSLHAMAIIGYDDARQAIRLINSWGRGWGDRGFAWLDYDVALSWLREAAVLKVTPPEPLPSPPDPVPPAIAKEELAATLARLNSGGCAHLEVEPGGMKRRVKGYVGSQADKHLLETAVASSNDVELGEVSVTPWPQCELRQTLAFAVSDHDRPQIGIGGSGDYVEGERLAFSVRSPGHFSYLYVAYVQADGSVVNLVQPPSPLPTQTPPFQKMTFGDGRDGRASFTIGAPFGQELVVVIASRAPLFDAALAQTQPAREYLSALRRALVYKPQAGMPDRVISAAVVPVRTRAKP